MTRRAPASQRDPIDELLRTAAAGDEAAFACLCSDLAPRIQLQATRILRDVDYAQEVTQEVLAEIWRTMGRYDPSRGTALGWVMTMARRRAVDRVRHEAASRRRDVAYGTSTRTLPCDETALAGDARMQSTAVRGALAALTPLQRQALELAYFRGLSHTQIAGHLDVPLGTIKSRIRDGLLRMRGLLRELAPEAA